MDAKHSILVIDDDAEIRRLVRDSLSERYVVLVAADGREGLKIAHKEHPDTILLDLLMPGMDGIEVARKLRADDDTRKIPIIVLTVVEDDATRARALRAGVDDLVTKPFRPEEFVERIEAKIRRARASAPSIGEVRCGNLCLDPATLEARVDERLVRLTTRDFHLLAFLATHVGRIFGREAILSAVWDNQDVSDRVIDNHVSTIRRRLEGFDHDIVTVYGAGYGIKSKGAWRA